MPALEHMNYIYINHKKAAVWWKGYKTEASSTKATMSDMGKHTR